MINSQLKQIGVLLFLVILISVSFWIGVLYSKNLNKQIKVFEIAENTNEYDISVSKLSRFCIDQDTDWSMKRVCLEESVIKQDQDIESLGKKIIEELKRQKYLEPESQGIQEDILKQLPDYLKIRKLQANQICSLKNIEIRGSGYGYSFFGCMIYYGSKDIDLLNHLLSVIKDL